MVARQLSYDEICNVFGDIPGIEGASIADNFMFITLKDSSRDGLPAHVCYKERSYDLYKKSTVNMEGLPGPDFLLGVYAANGVCDCALGGRPCSRQIMRIA